MSKYVKSIFVIMLLFLMLMIGSSALKTEGSNPNSLTKLHFYCFYDDIQCITNKKDIEVSLNRITEHIYMNGASDSIIEVTIGFESYIESEKEYAALIEAFEKSATPEEHTLSRDNLNKYVYEYNDKILDKCLEEIRIDSIGKTIKVGYAPFLVTKTQIGCLSVELLTKLTEYKDVVSVSVSFEKQYACGEDYLSANEWLNCINADKIVNNGTYTGKGIRIGVLEAVGVCNINNEALQGISISLLDTSNPHDHATQVVALIAKMAPKAEFYVAKTDVVGVQKFIAAGCDIVNCSFGTMSNGYNPSTGKYSLGPRQYRYDVDAVYDYQIKTCRINVVAITHNKNDNNTSPAYNPYSDCVSPGYAFNAITVGGVKRKVNTGQIVHAERACYETYVPSVKPDICAMYYVNAAGYNCSGTSVAAPQVTGCIALLMQSKPSYKNYTQRVRSLIAATAFKPVDFTRNTGFFNYKEGAGVIDLGAMCSSTYSIEFYNSNTAAYTNIKVVPIYLYKGTKLSASISWDITAQYTESGTGLYRVTNYDLLLFNNSSLTGSPLASSTLTNTNQELIEYTVQNKGQYYIVIRQTGAMYAPNTSDYISLTIYEH